MKNYRQAAPSLEFEYFRIVTLTAYEQLIAEGYLVTKAGAGTFVSDNIITSRTDQVKDYKGPDWFNPTGKILPMMMIIKIMPVLIFPSVTRQANYSQKVIGVGPGEKHLIFPIQTSVQIGLVKNTARRNRRFLHRTRNIKCHTDNIIITSGAAETLRLLAKATAEFAPMTFIENPGFKIARAGLPVEAI
ncbi:MAG: hypothetical protein H6912_06030 [Kordiimonadaceae bacterium]|nr:hypothetical protein [Kordiimonadaceae bacterium]